MYFNCVVSVPDVPGKITFKKKGGSTYVLLETDRVYLPERQYSEARRVVIGKLITTDSSSMYPNEKFEAQFPDVVLAEVLPESERSDTLHIGSYLIIRKVMDEYKITSLLRKWMGKDAGLFMDLVSYLLVEEDNAAQHYRRYAREHPLFTDGMHICDDAKISRFFKEIDQNQIHGFLNDWNRSRDRKQRIYLSYDSTNKNCQAGDIELIEFGKAKDDKSRPIFNIAVAFDKTNKIPLFYEEYPGSIPDVAELKYAVNAVMDYGYSKIGFILDRGYFSEENIRYMDDNGYSFVMMVKGKKALVSSLVESRMKTFESDHHFLIRPYMTYGITVSHQLFENDKEVRYFHIFYNNTLSCNERNSLEWEIEKQVKLLEMHQGEPFPNHEIYDKRFKLHFNKDGTLLFAEKRYDVIQRELDLCGYYCIVTSEKMTAEKALLLYKGRDTSEKLFAISKTFTGSKSERIHSEESLKGKLFVEFVTLIVRNRIYNLEKEAMQRKTNQLEKISVPETFDYMEELEITRRGNGKYRLSHALTARQKKILAEFGISEDDVKQAAHDLGNQLPTHKDLDMIPTERDKEVE
ncbi:MAG: transposase [Clostridia bacterium]|nr:transposase [Clostridia bacterium]